MKKLNLMLLMALVPLFSFADSDHGVDLTDQLLVNPGFEQNSNGDPYDGTSADTKNASRGVPFGWTQIGTLAGNSWGINQDAKNYSGNSLCWFLSRPMPTDFELYQTISSDKLTAGTYRISCRLWNQSDSKGNCRLFANNNVQYFGSEADYINNIVADENITFANHPGTSSSYVYLEPMEVYVTIAQGDEIRFGIRTSGLKSDGTTAGSNDPAGWFKIDDFKIEKLTEAPKVIGDDFEATNELLVNPDFELYEDPVTSEILENNTGTKVQGVPYGWTINTAFAGTAYGINNDAKNQHGANSCYFCNTAEAMPDPFEFSQTIPASKLTAGTYEVKCWLWSETGKTGTCRLFANNNVQYFGNEADYNLNLTEGENNTFAGYAGTGNGSTTRYLTDMVVNVTVAEGEDLKLGIRSSGMLADGTSSTDIATGWFRVDNFRVKKLEYTSLDETNGIRQTPTTVGGNTVKGVFNLNGQRISSDNNINDLSKGIYLVGGKKIVIR